MLHQHVNNLHSIQERERGREVPSPDIRGTKYKMMQNYFNYRGVSLNTLLHN